MIILPNILYINNLDPISGGPDIINANFADLSGYASTTSAGLMQIANLGDTLIPIPDSQKAVTPEVLNQRLSATFDILPAVADFYNLGNASMRYKNLFLSNSIAINGGILTVSGDTLYLNGTDLTPPVTGVGVHDLEDSSVHTNVSGTPTEGSVFIYSQAASGWIFGFPGKINPNGNPEEGDTLIYDSFSDTYLPGTIPSAQIPDPEFLNDIGDVEVSNVNIGDGIVYNGFAWVSDKVNRIIPQLEHRNFIFNTELLSGTFTSSGSISYDINTLDFYDPVLVPENVSYITASFTLSAESGGTAIVKNGQIINNGTTIENISVPLVSVAGTSKQEFVNIPIQRENPN
jgi:hypothetical protein